MRFERDRRRYLVTRALVRCVLSRYVAIVPRDWVFGANKYGRPHVLNDDERAQRLTFNIAHTNSVIVLAVVRERQIGVDVEDVRTRSASLALAERFFAHTEAACLSALPGWRQQQRFFEYWTLKESYIKARGMGLSIPLDQFSFQLTEDAQIQISIDAQLRDCPERWQFWQMWLDPSQDCLLALCAERFTGSATQLLLRRIVPLRSEQHATYSLLSASAGAACINRRSHGESVL